MKTILSRILFIIFLFSPLTASAFTVDSTNDTIDKDVGNGICEDADGDCTLRAAIMEANASTTADEINIPTGTYFLTLTGDEDNSESGDLDILYDTTLIGTGKQDEEVIVDAGAIGERAFDIHYPTETVVMQNFIIQNGSDDFGGAIYNQSSALSLTGMTVKSSSASNSGGGIYHLGTTLSLDSTKIESNTAYDGGGIFSYGTGNIAITNACEITSNSVEAAGGGLLIDMPQTETIDVTIENSKINSNMLTATSETTTSHTYHNSIRGLFDKDGIDGVGLYYYGQGTVEIDNSEFKSNVGTSANRIGLHGGGLYFGGYENKGQLIVNNSQFSQNSITGTVIDEDGGADAYYTSIYGSGLFVLQAEVLSLSTVTVSENSLILLANNLECLVSGAGLMGYDVASVTISQSDFSSNAFTSASETPDIDAFGIGNTIYATTVSIDNSHFDKNSSTFTCASESCDDIIIQGNGLLLGASTGSLQNSTVSENSITSDTLSAIHSYGAGLMGAGVLEITNSEFNNNTIIADSPSSAIYGGGAHFYGDVMIDESTFSSNSLTSGNQVVGGGFNINHDTLLSLTNSTVDHNKISSATGTSMLVSGGGISSLSATSFTVLNSTISSNQASNCYGGGIYMSMNNDEALYLSNVTITKNFADKSGGGIQINDNYSDRVTQSYIKNTILAGNSSASGAGADCSGNPLLSQGYNFIGDIDGCDFEDSTGDQIGDSSGAGVLTAQLGNLKNNGGVTKTHLPKKASPVIDAGNPDGCTDFEDSPFIIDQRNYTRPFDGDSDGTAICDIGAVERQGTDKDYTLSKPNKKIELPTGIFTH